MDEVEYTFEAGGDACATCQGMDGETSTDPIGLPHPACRCSISTTCNNTFDFGGGSQRYGPGGECFSFTAEITVTCWDGTEIGQTLPIDFGCEGADADFDGWMEDLYGQVADAAGAMMDGCPDCEPPVA